jgi:hypothetical protein
MKNINLKTTLPFTMTIFTLVALAIGIPTLVIFTLGSDAGETSDGLRFMIANDGRSVTITGYKGKAETIVIPGQIRGFPVTSIGFEAFDHCTGLTSVTLSPKKQVEKDAFPDLTQIIYRN